MLTKLFPVLEKFNEGPKYDHQIFLLRTQFPCEGGSNFILGIGRENQIFLLRTPATVKFFH